MEIARYWRTNNQRYTMTGSHCTHCGQHHISPRPVCDACQHEFEASGKDVIQHVSIPVLEPARK